MYVYVASYSILFCIYVLVLVAFESFANDSSILLCINVIGQSTFCNVCPRMMPDDATLTCAHPLVRSVGTCFDPGTVPRYLVPAEVAGCV